MTGFYECTAQVYCSDCRAGYLQHKAPDVPWPPWACAACGAENVSIVSREAGKVSRFIYPLAYVCPWCGLSMPPEGGDPILDRCCGLCATYSLEDRKLRNPGMGKLYDVALLYDTTVPIAGDLELQEDEGVGRGCDVGGHCDLGAGGDRDPGVLQTLRPPAGAERSRWAAMTQNLIAMLLLGASVLFLGFAVWRYRGRPRIVQPPATRVVQLSGSATPLLIDDTLPAPVDDDSPTQPYDPQQGAQFFDLQVERKPHPADQRLPRSAPAASGALTIEAKPIKGDNDDDA